MAKMIVLYYLISGLCLLVGTIETFNAIRSRGLFAALLAGGCLSVAATLSDTMAQQHIVGIPTLVTAYVWTLILSVALFQLSRVSSG